MSPTYFNIFEWFNIMIHELGHFVFGIFNNHFIAVAGGTILACLAPLWGMITFYRQNEFFGIALCFGWLSTVLFHTAIYIADSRVMVLPSLMPGGLHDWNYLLYRMGILQYDMALAFIIKGMATISMLICLTFGAWLLWQMRESS